MPKSPLDLESAEPAQIYAAIAEMEDDEFDALMEDPAKRPLVIRAMVEHMVTLFQPDNAEGVDAVIHVKLWDKPGGGYDQVELVVSDCECRVSADPENQPSLTLKVRPGDLRKLVTGESGPRRLAFRGRLRVLGDLGLGMKLPELFAFG